MTTPRHVPVLLDRVVALVSPALEAEGSVLRRLHARPRRPQRGGPRALPAGARHRHRPRPGRPRACRPSGSRRTASASPPCTRSTTSSPRWSAASASTTSTPSSSTSASPRCSSTSPTAASPTPQDAPLDMRMDPTTGHTAADVLNTYPGAGTHPHPARVRRGAVRPPDRPALVVDARGDAVHHQRPAGRAASARPSRRPPGAPAATRPSARSRRCGSRSTTSWARSDAPFPLRCSIGRSAAGSW